MAIDLYRQGEDGRWEILSYRPDDAVELQSIHLTFPIEQVYLGVEF